MKHTLKVLKKANRVALFSHSSPDPDTIGSTLALFVALKELGKSVDLFCDSEMPTNFGFIDEYNFYNSAYSSYDLLVAVDVAKLDMLGQFADTFSSHANTLRIDHHMIGECYAKHNLVKNHSACSILIFEIIQKLKVKVSPKIATLLFFALAGDTSCFRNSGTNSESFFVASKLLELGANQNLVYAEYFDKKTVPYLMLTSSCILNAEIDEKLGFVIMTATLNDYKKCNATVNESVGNLPNMFLSCGFKVAVILKEKEDGIRCSFRSAPEIEANKIASVFGGGGHKNAAGCLIEKSMSKAKNDVKKAIKNYLTKGGTTC